MFHPILFVEYCYLESVTKDILFLRHMPTLNIWHEIKKSVDANDKINTKYLVLEFGYKLKRMYVENVILQCYQS